MTSPVVLGASQYGGPSPLPPTPPANVPLVGAYPQPQSGETREQACTRCNTNYGSPMLMIRQYDHSNPTPTGNGPAETLAFGQACTSEWNGNTVGFMLSCRTDPVQTSAGTYDSAYGTLFDAMIARGVPGRFIMDHEFDGSKYGLHVTPTPSFTLAQLAAAVAHIYGVLRARPGNNALIKMIMCYTGYEFAGPGNRLLTYQPSFDGFCDGIGFDLYAESNTETMQNLLNANLEAITAYVPSTGPQPFACLPEVGTDGLTTAGINYFNSASSLTWLADQFDSICYYCDSSSPYQRNDNVTPANTNWGDLQAGLL
jgi:hypothetical protein